MKNKYTHIDLFNKLFNSVNYSIKFQTKDQKVINFIR
jgi:hypothetical protein